MDHLSKGHMDKSSEESLEHLQLKYTEELLVKMENLQKRHKEEQEELEREFLKNIAELEKKYNVDLGNVFDKCHGRQGSTEPSSSS
ncbi:hypothetical protein H6P81_003426 [Aristolochia fimbriata]|uniref:Uncharacterized protein n=1 Tax=Aristolochia fimbriata TaxID=158543 RepID=A0AAV7FCQ5_ARIFI|nr:hypothetical protein H6P81_003426 [Aristolochia fimbriata]